MKCDHCDKEATVREWTKKGGEKVEKHLCEECALKHGVAIKPQQQITQLITQLISAQAKTGVPGAMLNPSMQVSACASCSTTYAQFRHSGLLGCPACYQAFEGQLGPLLQRAHEGGTHHAGKAPPSQQIEPGTAPERLDAMRRAAQAAARLEKVKSLRDQLSEAVAAEQYEHAARLRDELASLESPGGAQQQASLPSEGTPT